jgi:hypothetical protein
LLLKLFDEVADVRRLQEQILARLDSLRPQPSTLDAPLFASLIPLAFAAFGTRTFCARDLVEYASEIAGQEPLRAALDAIGNARSIGRLLKRCQGARVGALTLCYVRSTPDGHTWKIVAGLKL